VTLTFDLLFVTLKFNRILVVVEIRVHAKIRQAKGSVW